MTRFSLKKTLSVCFFNSTCIGGAYLREWKVTVRPCRDLYVLIDSRGKLGANSRNGVKEVCFLLIRPFIHSSFFCAFSVIEPRAVSNRNIGVLIIGGDPVLKIFVDLFRSIVIRIIKGVIDSGVSRKREP